MMFSIYCTHEWLTVVDFQFQSYDVVTIITGNNRVLQWKRRLKGSRTAVEGHYVEMALVESSQ